MSQEDWPATVASVVAAEVRRYRRQRGLTAQQLADRCADLGLPFPRAVLANLETGRRPAVSVAELLVLAAALEVAPVLLIAPLGRQERVMILPDTEMSARDAILWLTGAAALDSAGSEPDVLDWHDPRGIIPLFEKHDTLIADLLDHDMWAGPGWTVLEGDGSEREAIPMRDLRKRAEEDLRGVRRRMRDLELTPPELPAQLADLEAR